ncbi:MAG: PQQ-binding-like beta-propeller repeat protein [Verrucomicrobia bacterium]|nr:PQQ-binding-like beta-propeller repeat protein [Verrucomicrobiota bacterium]
MNALFTSLVTGCLALAATLSASAGNWPGWRGPDGTGVSTEKNLPLKWSATENVRWRVELPGPGNSSPIVWGDRVFVTQAVSSENRRTVMCFDRATGKLLWQSGVTYTDKEPTQRSNPYCAATPVTDGERVIASFGSAGLFCFDFAGKEVWRREFGKMSHVFGNASSPVLAGDLCLLNFGPDEKARLIAVTKRDGKTVWEIDPPKIDPSEQQPMGGPGGGPGAGGGGRGGNAGIGTPIAAPMFAQADKNADKKLSKDEFTALAEVWFDRLDTDKAGKLSSQQFAEKFYDAMPPREGEGADGQRRGPSRTTAPAFFGVADTDKDGSLTRAELKATFAKWFDQWDAAKSAALNEDQFRDGLNAALPRSQSGGGGGQGGGGGRGPAGGTWSTPVLVRAEGRDELIMAFPNRLVGLDPKTGQQLWLSKGIGSTVYTTPLWGEGALVAASGGPSGGSGVAVKPGGSGDVTESRRLWRLERVKSAIGSGVVHEGHIYAIAQDGLVECLDLKTGAKLWEERLKGPTSRNSSWSSMLLAEGKIYVPNQSGDVFVLRAAPKFEVLATNSVGEPSNASLAASAGELFLRTDKALWCFGNAK